MQRCSRPPRKRRPTDRRQQVDAAEIETIGPKDALQKMGEDTMALTAKETLVRYNRDLRAEMIRLQGQVYARGTAATTRRALN